MRRAVLFLGLLMLTAVPSHALLQQRSFDYFANRAERYVDKQITIGCGSVYRRSSSIEHEGKVVLFDAWTLGDDGGNYCLVVVPSAAVESFVRKYNIRGRYDPRPLVGVLKRQHSGFYVSYAGALLPDAPRRPALNEAGTEAEPTATPVPFDKKPMMSFSYQGQRYIEASITAVDGSGVTVTAKDGASVVVPIAEAKKIPDLRMRARAAMEAAAPAAAP